MKNILPGISTLDQHVKLVTTIPEDYRPATCPYCGKAGLHLHGGYLRKADRDGSLPKDAIILIPRFQCPNCQRTCSVLPECIPPRRWYLWNDFQQVAIAAVLMGKSLAATAKKIIPSRHTVSRWFNQLYEKFDNHNNVLRQHIADLGRFSAFEDFWPACFAKISLSEAMLLCNGAGVNVP